MPKPPAHAVAFHRIADGLAHDQTPARAGGAFDDSGVRKSVDDHGRPTLTHPRTHDGPKLGRPMQPIPGRKHDAARRRRLSRQLGTALTATTGDNAAAGASAHAKTETVRLGTATVIRLESPLALGHSVLLRVSRWLHSTGGVRIEFAGAGRGPNRSDASASRRAIRVLSHGRLYKVTSSALIYTNSDTTSVTLDISDQDNRPVSGDTPKPEIVDIRIPCPLDCLPPIAEGC